MENLKEEIYTVTLIGLIHLVDIIFNKVGEGASDKILCTMGSHSWEDVPGSDTHRFCIKCGTQDDKTTPGIDADRRNTKIVQFVRKIRSRIRERKAQK